MNILIITPFYKQDRNIASVRWTNISQRLAKRHNIIIVTQPLDNDMDMTFSKKEEDGILVARMNQKTGYEKFAVKYFHGTTGDDWQTAGADGSVNVVQNDGLVRKIKNAALYTSMQMKAKSYAKQIVMNVIPKGMKIDVVISSACPFIEMLFGYEVKKRLGCKWISDFRDWPYNVENASNDKKIMKSTMESKLKAADAIIVVTNGLKDMANHESATITEKVHVITNGYSKNDKTEIMSSSDPDVLKLVHTGSLYGNERRSDLLFAAIRKLRDQGSKARIVVECAGGNNQSLVETAVKFGVADIVDNKGFVPREIALKMQNSADCLVCIVVNYMGGGFNGKILEYMLWNKPIINLSCGDPQFCEAAEVIRELNLGIAADEDNWNEDIEKLSDYLEMQAERKRNGLPLIFSPEYEKIKKYDYDSIAETVEKLCLSLCD